MALIKCPECGAMISDRADACPHCGCPKRDFDKVRASNEEVDKDASTEKNETKAVEVPINEQSIEENQTDKDSIKEAIPSSPHNTPSKPKKQKDKTLIFVAFGWVFIILVVIIASIINGGNSNENASEQNSPESEPTEQMEETTTNDVNTNEPISQPTNNWSYSQDKDELTGKTSYFASVTSDNSVNFDFPYNDQPIYLTVTIRKSPRYGTDVYISVPNGQFNTGIDGTTISVRFDDGKVGRYSCNPPSDGSSTILFINNAKSFIKKMKASKECRISAEFYQEGTPTFIFKTDGLEWHH